ncbi:hypothetical protein L6164_026303 [Bauhinia variegata]|nr:hypothetical protein L6164_026303 [Bauhinia variegata]
MGTQLVDRSITYPKGIVEDVQVKVEKFIFHVEFMIMDMDVGKDVPLLLGRPFLVTLEAMIDVHEGELTL